MQHRGGELKHQMPTWQHGEGTRGAARPRGTGASRLRLAVSFRIRLHGSWEGRPGNGLAGARGGGPHRANPRNPIAWRSAIG